MPYKSILVHVGNTADLERRVQLAARLASGDGTTVIGLAISGTSGFMSGMLDAAGESGAAGEPMKPEERGRREKLHLDMACALERFATLARQCGIATVQQLQVDDDTASALSSHGNASDLVIIGKNELNCPTTHDESDFVEFVALNVAAPVFTISEKPFAWRHALIAWNSSSAAARAVRNAIPILQDTAAVSAVIFGDGVDPGTHAAASEDDLRQCLASLAKPVDIIHRPAASDVGHALLALEDELDADLVVMGCVAHPRWRCALLGGTTGVMVAESPVSLLLSR